MHDTVPAEGASRTASAQRKQRFFNWLQRMSNTEGKWPVVDIPADKVAF
jgi:hypothetical protein